MADVLISIAVGLVSGALGAASKIGIESLNRINDTRSLASMLAAEIRAFQFTVEVRQYMPMLKSMINAYAAGQNPFMNDFVRDPAMWDSLYRQNLTKLGAIGPDATALVAKFYQLLRGLMLDVKNFAEFQATLDPVEKTAFLTNMMLVWDQANDAGMEAVVLLDEYARRSAINVLWGEIRRGL